MTQIIRSTLALLFAFGLYIFPQIVMSEVTTAKIMNNQISDPAEITKKNNDIVFYTLSEIISISLYKNIIGEPGSCAKIKILANKLIDLRSSSQQANYMLAACAEQEGNLEEALSQLQLSLSVDEFNTVYLLSLAIIQLNLNDLEKSQKTLDFISQINISTAGVDIVQDELTRRKFGNSS